MTSAKPSLAKRLAVSASVITNLVMGSYLVYVNGSSYFDTIDTANPVNFTGALLPVAGNITESSVVGNGSQTGAVIQNPNSEDVICSNGILNVTTAGEATSVDISRGTGSIIAGVNSATGTTLGDNVTLQSGVHVLSGSLLHDGTAPEAFVLDASGGTNDHILIVSTSTEAFSGTVLDYHFECYTLD